MSSKSSRILRMKSPRLGDLLVVQPAGGLVQQEERAASPRGPVRARPASGSRTAVPLPGRAPGRAGRRRRAPRAPRSPRHSVLAHVRRRARCRAPTSSGRAGCSGTCSRRPCARSLNAGCLRIDEPSSRTSPESGLVQARDDVERRRLAGAVRADQPRDVALLDVERDAVEGDDAAEAHRHVPYLEERHRSTTLNGRAAVATKSALSDEHFVPVRGVTERPDAQPRARRCGHGDREEPILVRPACAANPARALVVLEAHAERLPTRSRPDMPPQSDLAASPRCLHEGQSEGGVGRLHEPVRREEPTLPAGRRTCRRAR